MFAAEFTKMRAPNMNHSTTATQAALSTRYSLRVSGRQRPSLNTIANSTAFAAHSSVTIAPPTAMKSGFITNPCAGLRRQQVLQRP